ncbi:MAG: hypothetical protein SFV52_07710 [Saprospiraceae bacterium]|nr:hypothetical protein [Saprospiraceae bacterium]
MHTQDTIDAYVKGQLTPAEKAAFEADLARDPALADAVAQARLDLEVANLIIRDEVRTWMSTWAEDDAWSELDQAAPHSDSPSPPPTLSSRRFYLWMAAAAALTLVLAAVWFFRPAKPGAEPVIVEHKDNNTPPSSPEDPRPDKSEEQPSTQDGRQAPQAPAPLTLPKTDRRFIAMAEEGFQHRNSETFMRKGDLAQPNTSPDTVSLAAAALRKHQVDEAIRLAAGVPASDTRYADAQLLLGQAYFEQKQYARATSAIQKAIDTGKIPRDQANWNLLMTLVAQYGARKKEADALLKAILSDKDHPYYEDAEALARRLRE